MSLKKTIPQSARPPRKAAATPNRCSYVLRLYITGTNPRALRAVANIRRICEERLKNQYDLAIIDLSKNPELAKEEQIVAAPTLIKRLPLPLRRFIGDLSQEESILVGLGLSASPPPKTEEAHD